MKASFLLTPTQLLKVILLLNVIVNVRCSLSLAESIPKINTIHPNNSNISNNDACSNSNSMNINQSTIESSISDFLNDFPSSTRNEFHIQGWKWHTLSLIRDSKRLERLAHELLNENIITDDSDNDNDNDNPLEKATKHVIDFNMKALHKIEKELFFPFLKQKLSTPKDPSIIPKDVQSAFENVISDIENDRNYISKIAITLKEQVRVASLPNINNEKRIEAINNIAQMSSTLTYKTRSIYKKEEKYLIPAISILVPVKEQKSFSNKVLRNLGILDSRVHLVGMYDAVWEKDDETERELFVSAIPYLPRMMIPRWRKALYEPQAGVLD